VSVRERKEREREREKLFSSATRFTKKEEREGQNAVKNHPRFPRKNPETRANEKKLRVVALASHPFRFLRASANTARARAALLKFSKTLLSTKKI